MELLNKEDSSEIGIAPVLKTGIGKLMCRFESYLFRLFASLMELVDTLVLETSA